MSRKHIIIDIDENGKCSVEGHGFKGVDCEKFIKEVCDALGTTTDQRDTEEHAQRDRTRAVNRQRTGR